MKRSKLLENTGIILIVWLFIFLFSGHLFAATYYIDYNATNDSASGKTISTPWKRSPGMKGFAGTYVHANGDVFVFKGGVKWPSSTLPLVIANSGAVWSEDVYMSGHRCGDVGAIACNGGSQWGTTYAIFDGGNVQNAYSNGLISGGSGASLRSNIIVDGFKVINVGSAINGSGQGISLSGNNIEIRYNYISPDSVNSISSGCDGGIGKLYIHHNITEKCGRMYIYCTANAYNDIQIHNNTFMGPVWANPGGYHHDGIQIGAESSGTFGVTNIKIFSNIFRGSWSGSGGQGTTGHIFVNGAAGKYSLQHLQIYNNVMVEESSAGDAISTAFMVFQSSTFHVDDVHIYNNTMDGRSVPLGNCMFIGADVGNEAIVSNFTIINNIFSGCSNAIVLPSHPPAGTFTVDYNLYDISVNRLMLYVAPTSLMYQTCAEMQAKGFGTNYCSKSDPLFMSLVSGGNESSGNWHLKPLSPIIGKGINLNSYFTTDKDGIIRGVSWDIGAYKHPPAPPTNLRIVQ